MRAVLTFAPRVPVKVRYTAPCGTFGCVCGVVMEPGPLPKSKLLTFSKRRGKNASR